MMVQATVVWLAFDAGLLKVHEGLALAQFPKIEEYPNTEISKKVGASIRGTLNMLFGKDHLLSNAGKWSRYFWNRGLALAPCEVSDG